eukprot:SAG11_NODE_13085_length_671_cov_0.793706_1_plen_92_part_00
MLPNGQVFSQRALEQLQLSAPHAAAGASPLPRYDLQISELRSTEQGREPKRHPGITCPVTGERFDCADSISALLASADASGKPVLRPAFFL